MDPEPNVVYKECMRNHSVHLGLFVIDGCQEYYMSDQEGQNLCAACQCHRSFHRRVVLEESDTESDVVNMESTNNGGMQNRGGIVYKDCMRNHAEHLGLFETDGCQEYMSDQEAPGQNLCAACRCRRSFHRRIVLGSDTESDDGRRENTNNGSM